MKFVWLSFLVAPICFAGTNTLPVETSSVIQRSHINKFQTALVEDLAPRNTSGVATANAGSVGTSSYPFLKEFVSSGGWSMGDIKAHHSYNGAAPIGEGWMLCDGRQITESNYNAEHGTNHWATYVNVSPLNGLYLPDLTSRYAVGSATTTQSGSVAITPTGNASNQINLQHRHRWYHDVGASSNGQTWNSSGTLVDLSVRTVTGAAYQLGTAYGGAFEIGIAMDTYSDSSLSTTQSIQPDSIQVQYYMRIIP